jgi:parvulin-like peptidyl-prolyl isomerase
VFPLKRMGCWFVLSMVLFLFWGCGHQEETVIASVNGTKLTLDDLYAEVPEEYLDSITGEQKRQFLERWINAELLYQEALRQGLQRDPMIKEETREAERNILIANLIQRELDRRVVVTDDEARAYYQAHAEAFTRKTDEVRASQILVPTDEAANRIRKEIEGGGDFARLAREHSVDPSAQQGGDLGFFAREDVLPELAKFAFSSSPGTLSPPIKTEFGYHIITITDSRKAGSVRSFELVQDEIIVQFSMTKERQELDQLLQELRENSSIKQNLSLLDIVHSPAESTSALPQNGD